MFFSSYKPFLPMIDSILRVFQHKSFLSRAACKIGGSLFTNIHIWECACIKRNLFNIKEQSIHALYIHIYDLICTDNNCSYLLRERERERMDDEGGKRSLKVIKQKVHIFTHPTYKV